MVCAFVNPQVKSAANVTRAAGENLANVFATAFKALPVAFCTIPSVNLSARALRVLSTNSSVVAFPVNLDAYSAILFVTPLSVIPEKTFLIPALIDAIIPLEAVSFAMYLPAFLTTPDFVALSITSSAPFCTILPISAFFAIFPIFLFIASPIFNPD